MLLWITPGLTLRIGDDIRTIDWNVTARSQHPFVKKFVEERELTVAFLVDMSGLEGLWRVLSFLGLGLSLIGLGAVYRRFAGPGGTRA